MAKKNSGIDKFLHICFFLFKRLVSALIVFIMFVGLFALLSDYPEFAHDLRLYWLNEEYRPKLTWMEEANLKNLIQKGIIHTREDYVSSLTGYYSSIISTLIAFIGFFAIVQFGFILSQSKQAAINATQSHLDELNDDLKKEVKQQALDSLDDQLASFREDTSDEYESRIQALERKVEGLTAALKGLTDDPEQDADPDDIEVTLKEK